MTTVILLSLWLAAGQAPVPAPVPDSNLMIVTENTEPGRNRRCPVSRTTVFIKGHRYRTESLSKFLDGDCSPTHTLGEIYQCEADQVIQMDTQHGIYSRYRLPRTRDKPGAVDEDLKLRVETTDTGERKEFFGRTARHFITRVHKEGRTSNLFGAGSEVDFVFDGWYIEFKLPLPCGTQPSKFSEPIRSVLGGRTPREIIQSGPEPAGFPVLLTVTTKSEAHAPDGTVLPLEHTHVRTVVALSEAPVADLWFEVPSHFRKVRNLLKHYRTH